MSGSELQEGRVIDGRFRLLETLSEGGMGRVYLAEQLDVGRRVVLKFVLEQRVGNEASQARFSREARLAARINHPNVVSIIAFGSTAEGAQYLAMEFVEGQSLRAILEQSPRLETKRTLELVDQILYGLAEAHAQGLVHRDLKPENVMVSSKAGGTELVKVLDFGVAKSVEQDLLTASGLTAAGSIVGTPRYMAPEQADGEVDHRSDLYSVGVLLYEMLSGAHPIKAETPVQFIVGHVTQVVPRLNDLNPNFRFTPELQDVVERSLAKSPDARFQTALEMRRALRTARGLETSSPVQGGLLMDTPGRPLPGGRPVEWGTESGHRDSVTEPGVAVTQAEPTPTPVPESTPSKAGVQDQSAAKPKSEDPSWHAGELELGPEARAVPSSARPKARLHPVLYVLLGALLVGLGAWGVTFFSSAKGTKEDGAAVAVAAHSKAAPATSETPTQPTSTPETPNATETPTPLVLDPVEPPSDPVEPVPDQPSGAGVRIYGEWTPTVPFDAEAFMQVAKRLAVSQWEDAKLIEVAISGLIDADGKVELSGKNGRVRYTFRSPEISKARVTPNSRGNCIMNVTVFEDAVLTNYQRIGQCHQPFFKKPHKCRLRRMRERFDEAGMDLATPGQLELRIVNREAVWTYVDEDGTQKTLPDDC